MSKENIAAGKTIGSTVVRKHQTIDDMVLVWGWDNSVQAFTKESIAKKAVTYKIEGAEVEAVYVPKNYEMVILKTKNGEYVRDFNNQEIKEAEHWADYYFEPFTESFYRKDTRDRWYDIEGFRLGASVFLKDTVLCSLPGKTSKKSMSFSGQNLVISPAAKLIQVGKLVYDENLEFVHYFGEKITGLGARHVSFGGEDVLQEVFLGLKRTAFINEFTKEPYLINNQEITEHVQTVSNGRHHFEVFKSGKQKYVVEDNSKGVFSFEGTPVTLDFSTLIQIGIHELILVKRNREKFYMNINSKEPFTVAEFDKERIIHIDQECIRIDGDELFSMETPSQAFVYNDTKQEIFTLNNGLLKPQSIARPEGFETYYSYAKINGIQKLWYKKNQEVIDLGDGLEITEILSKPGQKLINIKASSAEQLVVDARKGWDNLVLAKSGDRKIIEVLGEPFSIGKFVLQNARLETLGGSEPRVIDLNTEDLAVFTLPMDLKEYSEAETASSFKGNPVLEIDFENTFKIEEHEFLNASFRSYFGNVHPVPLLLKNARPLHLEGAGHRNELVTRFEESTQRKKYFLGPHRMIGAITLTEDLKDSELLFSLNMLKSWLPFHDSYLPIFKKITAFKDEAQWEYHLFELRGISNKTEYVAVEKKEPYRILVEKKKGLPVPKIVKRKEKSLKTPEEISAIRKFFLEDPGYLVEVE